MENELISQEDENPVEKSTDRHEVTVDQDTSITLPEEQISEQQENIVAPEGKVYTIQQAVVSSFFGGVLIGGYFIYKNFKTFKEDKKADKALLYTLIGTLFFFVVLMLINSWTFSRLAANIASIVVVRKIMDHYQGLKINEHIQAGGKVHSWWTVILQSILVTIIVGCILVFILFPIAVYIVYKLS